jgi:hypothetical protein
MALPEGIVAGEGLWRLHIEPDFNPCRLGPVDDGFQCLLMLSGVQVVSIDPS